MSEGVKITREGRGLSLPATLSGVTGSTSGDNVEWDDGSTPPGSVGGISTNDQWKQPVRVATTANITIATALNNGDSLDGVTLATGDRVLVKDQSTASQNGIYVVAATPARSLDMDASAEVLGAVVYVIAGTVNTHTAWSVTNTAATVVGTDAINWAPFGGSGGSALTIKDEGTPLATAATSIDFVGPGVVASGAGAAKTVTIFGTDVDAVDVAYDNSATEPDIENVQEAIDALYGHVGWTVDSLGSLTAGGSPQTVINDSSHNGFPGLCRLDPDRVLLVYPGAGTDHENGHEICGQIGTLNGARDAVTWGSRFTILSDVEDLRCEGGASIIEGEDGTRRIVIPFRYYTGTGGDNHDPSIIICDDEPTDFTSASTWGSPIATGLALGAVQNYTQDRVQRLQNGTLLLPSGYDSGGTHTVGVWRWAGDLEDIATGAFVTVGSGVNDYAELCIVELPTGTLRAHIRTAGGTSQYKAESTDHGATWTSPSVLYTAEGFPMFRRLSSGLMLTVYRKSPLSDNAWRQATDDTDTTWGGETVLDTTGDHSAYANALQITPNKILVVYAVETVYPPASDGDIYAQWFTDSSTFAVAATAAADVTFDPTGLTHTDATDLQEAIQDLDGAIGSASGGVTDHFHIVDEQFSGDGATTVFDLANEAVVDTVMAYVAGTRTPVTLGGSINDKITFGSAPASGTLNVSVDYAAVSS